MDVEILARFFAFISSSITIALLLIMVAVEVFPYLLYSTSDPAHSITVHNGSASSKTMKILLIIALIERFRTLQNAD